MYKSHAIRGLNERQITTGKTLDGYSRRKLIKLIKASIPLGGSATRVL
jgi:hypothetical protein